MIKLKTKLKLAEITKKVKVKAEKRIVNHRRKKRVRRLMKKIRVVNLRKRKNSLMKIQIKANLCVTIPSKYTKSLIKCLSAMTACQIIQMSWQR